MRSRRRGAGRDRRSPRARPARGRSGARRVPCPGRRRTRSRVGDRNRRASGAGPADGSGTPPVGRACTGRPGSAPGVVVRHTALGPRSSVARPVRGRVSPGPSRASLPQVGSVRMPDTRWTCRRRQPGYPPIREPAPRLWTTPRRAALVVHRRDAQRRPWQAPGRPDQTGAGVSGRIVGRARNRPPPARRAVGPLDPAVVDATARDRPAA